MMMKTVLGAALFALHSTLFTSCRPETDNVFDEPAAIRLQKLVADYTAVLESNTDGWAMDFYPGESSLGGLAYTALFKDGDVTLSCERVIDFKKTIDGDGKISFDSKSSYKYAAGEESTSGYTIKSENSVTLSFDTFNGLIHYWSQPFSIDLDGYASDYEFTFLSACKDSVVLRGKKHGSLMRLYPLSETPKDYIDHVVAMRNMLGEQPRKRIIADGQTSGISLMENHFKYFEGTSTFDVPYTYTSKGIRFYCSIDFNGRQTLEMDYDDETQELVSADGHIRIPAPTQAEYFTATSKQWYFNYNNTKRAQDVCDELRDIINTCADEFNNANKNNGGIFVNEIYLGYNLLKASEDSHRMVLGFNYKFLGNNYFGYAIDMQSADTERPLISIRLLEGATGYGQHPQWQPFVDFVGQNSPYLLSFDSDEDPTEVILTSEKDDSKWFKLKRK